MKKRAIWVAGILALAAAAVVLLAHNRKALHQEAYSEIYSNEELGFSLALPGKWAGQYEGREGAADSVELHIALPSGRFKTAPVAYIFRYTQEEWAQEKERMPAQWTLLGEGHGYTYILTFPGDVNYDPADRGSTATYQKRRAELEEGKFAFKVL